MIGGTLIAWWGAILGTVGTGISIWNYWRDRPRIKVSVAKNIKLSENDMTDNPEEMFVMITAANVSKLPVYLSKAYFTLRTSTQSILLEGPHNFSTKILNPGLRRDFLAIQSRLDLSDIKEAYVVDAVDRKFKCKVPRSWQKNA
ncbi:MAG: hypothetical protein ABII09_09310 [Planctomycetota bacterium]